MRTREKKLPSKEKALGKSQSAGTQILDFSPQAMGERTAGRSSFTSIILTNIPTTACKLMRSSWEQRTQPDQRQKELAQSPCGEGKRGSSPQNNKQDRCQTPGT